MTAGNRQSTFTGTKEVAERLRFDVGRLESYLRDHVEGFAAPITVQQFKGGQSNPTYLIETPCFGANRPASSCRPHMRWTVNTV